MIYLIFSYAFLIMPIDSKVVGVGSASTALNPDVSGIFWNPAVIGNNKFTTTIMNFGGLNYYAIGRTLKIKGINFGLGMKGLYSGEMVKRDTLGRPFGSFQYIAVVPIIGFSKKMMNNLTIGAKLFFPFEKVTAYTSYGLGFEFGAIYKIYRRLNLGVYGRNFGFSLSPFISEKRKMENEIRVGVAYFDKRFILSGDIFYPFGIATGVKIPIKDFFSINFGYNTLYNDLKIGEGIDPLKNANFGFSVRFSNKSLMYNAIFAGPLGIVHNIGIEF